MYKSALLFILFVTHVLMAEESNGVVSASKTEIKINIGSSPDADEPPVEAAQFTEFALRGVKFGGIIGASLVGSLQLGPDWPVKPELLASAGISGSKFGLGLYWPLSEASWVIQKGGQKPFKIDRSNSLSPRIIACYRWEEQSREPDFWRGIVGDQGWYVGGEIGLTWGGLAFDLAMTWNEENRDSPRITLGYGFTF